MKTQILDCDIIVNARKINIINSEMNIDIEWDIETEKTNENVSVKPIVKSLKGFVSFTTTQPSYKKVTKMEFTTDLSWTINSKTETINLPEIQPMYSLIDFDEKRVIISY